MLILIFLKICFQICYLMCPQINLEIKGRVRVELSVSQPGSDAVERLGWLCCQGHSSACAASSLSPVLSYRDSWAWTQGRSVKEMVETDWRSRGTRSPSALPCGIPLGPRTASEVPWRPWASLHRSSTHHQRTAIAHLISIKDHCEIQLCENLCPYSKC